MPQHLQLCPPVLTHYRCSAEVRAAWEAGAEFRSLAFGPKNSIGIYQWSRGRKYTKADFQPGDSVVIYYREGVAQQVRNHTYIVIKL